MTKNLKEVLKKVRSPEISWVGLREVREVVTDRVARDGKPESNDVSESHGVMAEVLVEGQFGYAATSARDDASILEAIDRARIQAQKAARYSVFKFTEKQRPPTALNYESLVGVPFHHKHPGELNDLLVKITEKLKTSPKIIRSVALIRLVETEMHWVSSNGADISQKFSLITHDFEATAQEGSIIQRRTHAGMRGRSLQGGWEHLFTPDLWERVDQVSREAHELIAAPECPTGTLDLMLMPDQMMLQIHESIGHPLELDRILGDERNYAGWSFVKPTDFGKLKYGSPLMNISFDPTIKHEYASYAADDNGVQAKKEFIIKDGILVRALGGIESQARSGIPGVANARSCSWNRAPIDRMANLNLEPGTSSIEEMIESVDHGVLMFSNRSWSIDDFRNKFQFGCEYAKEIKNGKIVGVVRNPNYRGITVPFWNSLKKVGNKNTFDVYGTPNCGKGEPNQSIRVGHAAPACLFSNIEIFGGGK